MKTHGQHLEVAREHLQDEKKKRMVWLCAHKTQMEVFIKCFVFVVPFDR